MSSQLCILGRKYAGFLVFTLKENIIIKCSVKEEQTFGRGLSFPKSFKNIKNFHIHLFTINLLSKCSYMTSHIQFKTGKIQLIVTLEQFNGDRCLGLLLWKLLKKKRKRKSHKTQRTFAGSEQYRSRQ